jgi:hypothetical protein
MIYPSLMKMVLKIVKSLAGSFWVTLGIGVVLLLFCFVPQRHQIAATKWMLPVILLVTIGKLYLELRNHGQKPITIEILATIALVLLAGFRTIAEFKSRQFDPIRSASGTLFINFDRLIPPGQLKVFRGFSQAGLIKAPLTNNVIQHSFTVTNVEIGTTGKIEGSMITAEQVTEVRFTLSSDSPLLSNHLDEVSANSLNKDFDYLTITMMFIEPATDCALDGVLHLVLNGRKEYHFDVPRHVYRKGAERIIAAWVYAPLNEHALKLMYEFPGSFPKDPNFKLDWANTKN